MNPRCTYSIPSSLGCSTPEHLLCLFRVLDSFSCGVAENSHQPGCRATNLGHLMYKLDLEMHLQNRVNRLSILLAGVTSLVIGALTLARANMKWHKNWFFITNPLTTLYIMLQQGIEMKIDFIFCITTPLTSWRHFEPANMLSVPGSNWRVSAVSFVRSMWLSMKENKDGSSFPLGNS